MEDLLSVLFAWILELLAEVLLQIAFGALCDLTLRSLDNFFSRERAIAPLFAVFGFLICGLVAGLASIFLVPHPILHPSKFHGISLLISPLLTGLLMSQIGSALRRNGRGAARIESFAYGFTFALGLAAVRLALAA